MKEVEALLEQAEKLQDPSVLIPQTEALKDALGSLVENIYSQQSTRHFIDYDSDNSEYLQEKINEELWSLENSHKQATESIEKLCKTFNLAQPDLKAQPLVTIEMLMNALDTVLEATVPGKRLIEALLNPNARPETVGDYVMLATDLVFDLMPGGTAIKLLKGTAGKVLKRKMGKLFLKNAKKICKINASAARVKKFGHLWQKASLEKAIERHAGPNATSWITKTGKNIYENPVNGRQVVVDQAGYFRIFQPESFGSLRGNYLDLMGKPPAPAQYVKGGQIRNIPLGRDELNAATHFLIN